MNSKPILLVDDTCTLCNRSVGFIMKNVGEDRYRFLSLTSAEGRKILGQYGLPEDYNDSLVLISDNKAYIRSDAVLRIAMNLKGLYILIYALIIVPRPVRDAVYSVITKHRHKF